jgi:hypothetical protein
MPQTIFFRVGNADKITLNGFIECLRGFLGVLQDLDAALANDKSGSAIWEVTFLRKGSPPIVGITPAQRHRDRPNLGEAVEAQFIDGVTALTIRGDRGDLISDSALLRLKKVAAQTKRIGSHAVYVNGAGELHRETAITETTFRNVAELTDPRYSAFGSIVGKLEAISVHKGDEFRVWDRATGRPVTCKFSTEWEEGIKKLLRQTVTVSGTIHANSQGTPISLDLEGLDAFAESTLPSIREMSGLVENFTLGKTLKEYLEDTPDE